MEKKDLKEDVLDSVRLIYKEQYGARAALLAYAPWDYWVEPFQKLFPDLYVRSETDFNYSVCFKVIINLSPITGDIFSDEFRGYIDKNGFVDVLVVEISAIAPYANLYYVRRKKENGKYIPHSNVIPFEKEHAKYGEEVEEYLKTKDITCLPKDILFSNVGEGISLELRKRDVKIYHCLFHDSD